MNIPPLFPLLIGLTQVLWTESEETTTMAPDKSLKDGGWKACVRCAALAYIRVRECQDTCGDWTYIYPTQTQAFVFSPNNASAVNRMEMEQLRLMAWGAFGTQIVNKAEWKQMTLDVQGSMWGLHFYKMNKRCE